MTENETNRKLENLLKQVDDEEGRLTKSVFSFCETQEERQRMIDYIEIAHPPYGKICEYAAVIAIQAGSAEGELEKCDESYWF